MAETILDLKQLAYTNFLPFFTSNFGAVFVPDQPPGRLLKTGKRRE